MLTKLWRKLVCTLRLHHWGAIYFNPISNGAVFLHKCDYCGIVTGYHSH
jgi:hypothetical protein